MNIEKNTIITKRFEMTYFKFGTGERIFVMIPGVSIKPVSDSAAAVAAAYARFAEDYTVYVFDRAKSFGDTYSIEDMARDTAEAMKTVGIKDAFFMGASQGGMILQCIARDNPELINRGLLASTASRQTPDSLRNLEHWRELALAGDAVALNRRMFEQLYTPEYLEKYKRVFKELEKQGSPEELRKFAVLLDACTGFDGYEALAEIRCPMLVIGAANDPVLPAEQCSRELAEGLGCELYVYKHYRHGVYDEAPDFKDRILAFFEQ